MDMTKAVAKLRAQSAANRERAQQMVHEAVQVVKDAEERSAQLRISAQEEMGEADYWEALADREAAKIPPTEPTQETEVQP